MENGWPSVSVVIPARNAASTIGATIDAVLTQEYPGQLEIVVGDGSDDDATVRLLSTHYPGVLVVPNPDGGTSAGLNRAIAACSGEIIARCDAHAFLQPGYIRRAVETVERTGAAVVGGLQVPDGKSLFQRAVGIAMSSIVGAGNSSHKIGGTEGPTDTVYLGVFRRGPLIGAGCFDETLVRNQDYELNWRFRLTGDTVWLDPELRVNYQPRKSMSGLCRQYFEYGWWKAVMLQRNPKSLRMRQMAAPALVVGLLGSLLLGVAGHALLALAAPLFYLGLLVAGSTYLTIQRRDLAAGLLLPVALSSMHVSWGTGFILSCLRMGIRAMKSNRPADDTGCVSRKRPSGEIQTAKASFTSNWNQQDDPAS